MSLTRLLLICALLCAITYSSSCCFVDPLGDDDDNVLPGTHNEGGADTL
jgi:hypothetical protein